MHLTCQWRRTSQFGQGMQHNAWLYACQCSWRRHCSTSALPLQHHLSARPRQAHLSVRASAATAQRCTMLHLDILSLQQRKHAARSAVRSCALLLWGRLMSCTSPRSGICSRCLRACQQAAQLSCTGLRGHVPSSHQPRSSSHNAVKASPLPLLRLMHRWPHAQMRSKRM
jgi:hypothetical protein